MQRESEKIFCDIIVI